MAFSFECPHCEMAFEAEFELCGSTCTCPGCGNLFLVPEVDPESLGAGQDSVAGGLVGGRSGAPDAALLAELEQLRSELTDAAQKRRDLEREMDRQKAGATREKALSAELKTAKETAKKTETLAKDLERRVKDLEGKLEGAEKSEQTIREQMRAAQEAEEQARKELAAALEDARRAKLDAEEPVKELAKLREDARAAEAKLQTLNGAIAVERKKTAEQLESLRLEIATAEEARKSAERQQTGSAGEVERLSKALDAERALGVAALEKLELARKEKDAAQAELEERSRLARVAVEEANRRHADEVAGLQETLSKGRARVRELEVERERAALVASDASKEMERLRAELAGVKAEKWSAERGFAEEHQRLLEQLQCAEAERDTLREEARLLARAAAEPDGELERLRSELSAALSAGAGAEKALVVERNKVAERQRVLEQATAAAEERTKALLEEMAGLRLQLQQAETTTHQQKASEGAPSGLSAEAEAELRQVLAGRDQEIQRLAGQIRSLSQNPGGDAQTDSLPGWISARAAVLLSVLVLGIGLFGGVALSRQRSANPPIVSLAEEPSPGRDSSGTPQGLAVVQSPPPLSAVGGDSAPVPSASVEQPVSQTPVQGVVAGGSFGSSRAGMPAHLPDQFLGIRFGTDLSLVPGIAQWKETAGKRHRKAELLGSEVEAVLTADGQNRLIMGSYVRVASRQAESLTPFLEWAVNVQDAVSALYGEPIRVHSVDGAVDAVEVVRKIAAGEDYYQASWERENEEGMIDLSIRVFNERSVVFRMEYRARQYYAAFMEGQAAREAPKESAKESAKESVGEGGATVPAPAKVE